MQTANHVDVPLRAAIAAAAEITGASVSDLLNRDRRTRKCRNTVNYRAMAHMAAVIVTGDPERVSCVLGPGARPMSKVASQRLNTARRISRLALKLARDPDNLPHLNSTPVSPSVVLAATARVFGSSVKDLVAPGRMEPWANQRLCAYCAGRRLGVSIARLSALMGRKAKTMPGRAVRFARFEAQNAANIARIVRQARTYAELPTDQVAALLRPPVVMAPTLPGEARNAAGGYLGVR